MTYNVFGGTLNLTEPCIRRFHLLDRIHCTINTEYVITRKSLRTLDLGTWALQAREGTSS